MKRSSRTLHTMVFVIFLIVFSLGLGCATYRPAKSCGKEEEDNRLSLAGTKGEFLRGVTNVACCWMEIPYEVEASLRETKTKSPFGLFSHSFAAAFATVRGSLWTVERATGGIVEMGISPFPPYDPIMKPAYPPYLNKKSGEEPSSTKTADVESVENEG